MARRGASIPKGSPPQVIFSTSSARSMVPGRTSSVWSTAKAVSSPVTPIAACSKGTSFSSEACGAWSVATQSIVPSASPSISAWRSSSVRSGGFILKRASRLRTSSSVSTRWWGEASQVTWTPAAFAERIASTEARAERCWTWIRPSS